MHRPRLPTQSIRRRRRRFPVRARNGRGDIASARPLICLHFCLARFRSSASFHTSHLDTRLPPPACFPRQSAALSCIAPGSLPPLNSPPPRRPFHPPLLPSFMKAHSDLRRRPSAAALIKDTRITRKIRSEHLPPPPPLRPARVHYLDFGVCASASSCLSLLLAGVCVCVLRCGFARHIFFFYLWQGCIF